MLPKSDWNDLYKCLSKKINKNGLHITTQTVSYDILYYYKLSLFSS